MGLTATILDGTRLGNLTMETEHNMVQRINEKHKTGE